MLNYLSSINIFKLRHLMSIYMTMFWYRKLLPILLSVFSLSATWKQYMMISWHGNAFRITGPLWGVSTGHKRIPLTKGQWCGALIFLWCQPELTAEKTVERRVNRNVLMPMWRHCNAYYFVLRFIVGIVERGVVVWTTNTCVAKRNEYQDMLVLLYPTFHLFLVHRSSNNALQWNGETNT